MSIANFKKNLVSSIEQDSEQKNASWQSLVSGLMEDTFQLDKSPKYVEHAIRGVLSCENNGVNFCLSNDKLRELFSASACLGFTMWQNLSAFERLSHSQDWQKNNQADWEKISESNSLVGLGVTHLMKETSPVNAQETEAYYVVSGKVPWISGMGIFQYFLIGFRIDDYNYIVHISADDLFDQKSATWNHIDLIAFGGTNSVELQIDGLEIPKASTVVKFKTGEKSQNYVSQYVFPESGIARRALDELRLMSPNSEELFALQAKVEDVEKKSKKAVEESNYDELFNLQVERDLLINNCVRVLALHEGGKAMTKQGYAGLLNKQSLLLDVIIQPPKIKKLKIEGLL